MKIKLFIAASLMMLSVGVYAQNQGNRPAPPKRMTPEEFAKKEADQMKSEVNLTDKQYKKVYNLIKKDRQYRQSQMEEKFGNGMPPMGGGPGGMGGPGMGGPGGFSGGMGGPGGGSMGGGMMGGGRPPQGEMGQRPRPEGGHPGMGPDEEIVTEEYLEKQEQKLKKILTAEQYSKWRSSHPAEHLELPPLEF